MRITALRNATLLLEIATRRVLVDPMLGPAGSLPAVDPASEPRRNPLVDLPADVWDLVEGVDMALVTHLHRDHFDADAAERLPPGTVIVTQPDSAPILRWMGFGDVRNEAMVNVAGLKVRRTSARHTLDPVLSDALGPTCGFAVTTPGEPRLLVAGDCVWCDELASALDQHSPDIVVVNAGAGRIGDSLPISMTAQDMITTAHAAPSATIVAVHLEALSHCPMTRAQLRLSLRHEQLQSRVLVPDDGARLTIR